MERFVVLVICGVAAVVTAKLTARAKPFDWLVDEAMTPWIFF
jgi:hypothetical protein